ncbi:MAG: tetratricopeptide repeat protein [Firmicutes bacterium]|nr:tetratricopeptide repeat protein [Bacillota bacterium]
MRRGSGFVLKVSLFVISLIMAAIASAGQSVAPDDDRAGSSLDWNKILEENDSPSPDDWRGHLLKAISYANTGKMLKANDEFALLSAGDYEKNAALVVRENSAKLAANPDDILALNCMAFSYYALGQDEKAIEQFERLVRIDSKNVWIRHYLAYLYTRVGRLDEGISVLREALEIDPKNEYTHLLLGLAYQKKGWTIAALLEFLKAPNARREALKLLR